MTAIQATRTLVKSVPELWAELGDVEALARHLEPFGEIRITSVEKEQCVAWEADDTSGTIELVASGFGTSVTLTAIPASMRQNPQAAPAPVPAEPEGRTPERGEPACEPPLPTFWGRLFGRRRSPVSAPVEPVTRWPEPPAAPGESPDPGTASNGRNNDDAEVLVAVLDSLGAAHHRPFSRG
ncbi:MAG TPA: hypothetical protein VHE14_04850 [Solirubrobacteraceae bacterium]|nr:hypothetical protein [Solirubrobacteraceae bacterium]